MKCVRFGGFLVVAFSFVVVVCFVLFVDYSGPLFSFFFSSFHCVTSFSFLIIKRCLRLIISIKENVNKYYHVFSGTLCKVIICAAA